MTLEKQRTSKYSEEIVKNAHPLTQNKLGPLIHTLKDKKIVMLGESSHGTKEFYQWRSFITKELVQKHGFKFIAVEGDWPPSQAVNEYIQTSMTRNKDETNKVLENFSRWPTWMWANSDVVDLVDWMKEQNIKKPASISFYGLDIYSLYESMDQVIFQLSKIDSSLAREAINYYSCFDSYQHDEMAYARSLFNLPEGCREMVMEILIKLLGKNLENISQKDQKLNIIQNAKIVANAENYYRAMVLGEEDSWNIRDNHMMETLTKLLDFHGEDSKCIVWEHNTHIGDYRATDMLLYGQVNLGGLAREKYGMENVALVGFTTHSGTVIASPAWDGPVVSMKIPEAKPGSVEHELHNAISEIGTSEYYLLFNETNIFSALSEVRGHRAIGVVYHPPSETHGNYVPTSLSNRYDALVFIDKTNALNPLEVIPEANRIPETYPYGTHI